jgi:hypothetical protein
MQLRIHSNHPSLHNFRRIVLANHLRNAKGQFQSFFSVFAWFLAAHPVIDQPRVLYIADIGGELATKNRSQIFNEFRNGRGTICL